MASWAEASREAMFKRVEGGFIFRARPHNYLLTEAQKAEIQRLMGYPTPKRLGWKILGLERSLGSLHPVLLVLLVLGIFLLVGRLVFGVHQYPLVRTIVYLTFFSFGICGLVFAVIKGRSAQKRISSVLEGARHTEQQITLRDRTETYARMLPLSVLFGAVGASALLFILFLFLKIDVFTGMSAGVGVVFLYLAIFKLRLERLPKR